MKRNTIAGELTRYVAEDRGYKTPCWIWQGGSSHGYGIMYAGAPHRAHRASYEHSVGPIPEGLTIDHLCRQTLCINPSHLEPVTAAENSRRMMAAIGMEIGARRVANRPNCKLGHPYVEGSYRIRRGGGRICKQCEATRGAENFAKALAADHAGVRKRRYAIEMAYKARRQARLEQACGA